MRNMRNFKRSSNRFVCFVYTNKWFVVMKRDSDSFLEPVDLETSHGR